MLSKLVSGLTVSSLGVTVVLLAATYAYIDVMYDNDINRESVIEGTSFAMQTVTTVGFGNWEHPALGDREPNHMERVLTLRALSIGFMLFGATFYMLLTGVVVAGLIKEYH
jgi:hypothetical protein